MITYKEAMENIGKDKDFFVVDDKSITQKNFEYFSKVIHSVDSETGKQTIIFSTSDNYGIRLENIYLSPGEAIGAFIEQMSQTK